MISSIPDRLRAISVSPYKQFTVSLLKGPVNPGKGLVNDKQVTDHHAIIPTEEKLDLSVLSHEERNVYDLIARRFLMVLSPANVYEQIVIITLIGGEKFFSKLKLELEAGWKKIDKHHLSEESKPVSSALVSRLRKGVKQPVNGITLKASKTIPPARFTEASLLTAMEFPGKYIKDKELLASIQNCGLGTPATRADIIEKLVNSDYIFRKSRQLVPTPKGYQLIELVPPDLKSPELTAKWELDLENISRGKRKKEGFIADIVEKTRELVEIVKNDTRTYKAYNQTKVRCPVCSNFMLLIKSGRGNMLKCSDLKCGYTQKENKKEDFLGRKSKKESRINKSLINRYSDNKKKSSGISVGSLFEDALMKKK
jgi:DNA topoisomerase-3